MKSGSFRVWEVIAQRRGERSLVGWYPDTVPALLSRSSCPSGLCLAHSNKLEVLGTLSPAKSR